MELGGPPAGGATNAEVPGGAASIGGWTGIADGKPGNIVVANPTLGHMGLFRLEPGLKNMPWLSSPSEVATRP